MKFFDFLLGRYLATSEEEEQRVGPISGIPMLGLDALSSSAYGTEAALTILLPLGAASLTHLMPISTAIILVLFIVFLSYRQTIAAYPNGGGSYTVAKENLGLFAGLLAAAALLLDYILTVAVGISAGIGALISAVPSLQPHTLHLCLLVLVLLTISNLRGVKESGAALSVPTYLFLGSLLAVTAIGIGKVILSGGHPVPVDPIQHLTSATVPTVSMWLLLRAFSSGCAAITGVEAVSNGVKAFREPSTHNARLTLTIIILVLIVLLAGIAFLSVSYGVGATEPGQPGYESVVSQLVRAVVGHGIFYFVTIGSVIAALCVSANTGFADFPRLCQILANDDHLPHVFSERGRRLVFSYGIISLAIVAAILLIIFDGITDRLIPLYAMGAFLAFTLSQAGMVVHWRKTRQRGSGFALAMNALGACTTGVTLVIVLISKFSEGGWITAIITPLLLWLFYGVRRHYRAVAAQIQSIRPLSYEHVERPIAIVPVRSWNAITRKAMSFAVQLSDDVYAVHVESEALPAASIEAHWEEYVAGPARRAGQPVPHMVRLPSPYRRLFGSIFDFISQLEKTYPSRRIAFVIPNLAEYKWYHFLLHNQRAVLLSAALFLRRDRRVVVVTVPWFLES